MDQRANEGTSSGGLNWAWIVIGLILGIILIGTLVPIVRDEVPRPDAAVVIGALTFMLTGILVGFRSPGKTLVEPGISGIGLAALTFLALRFGFLVTVPFGWMVAGLIVGPALAVLGGWVGEVLQGTLAPDADAKKLQWPWIWVGTALGVMLNFYAVFLPHAIFDLPSLGILLTFLASFFVAAFFVAYFSPGVTILEPALAAFFMVSVDLALVLVGFNAPFPLLAVALAGMAGFAIGLAGGYAGEVAYDLHRKSAWGQAPGSYREVAKPGVGD